MMTENSLFDQKSARFESEAVPHFQSLRRFALYLTRSSAEGEDLLQETFAQALKSFDKYEAGTNCRAWLCKIMYFKRAQWIRANARLCQFDDKETRIPTFFDENLLPCDFVGNKLSLALADLPEKFRRIVWLATVEEYTYNEISGELSIPIGTVMSRLHRGRKMLRAKYDSRLSVSNSVSNHH